MSGMALWTHENQIRWANVTNFRIHLSGEMNVFRFNFTDLEMLPRCGFMERMCALEKGRSYLKTFFHWLCDLNRFFNLLDSQFSHLQNGRYISSLCENVVRNTENAYYLFFCPVSGKN